MASEDIFSHQVLRCSTECSFLVRLDMILNYIAMLCYMFQGVPNDFPTEKSLFFEKTIISVALKYSLGTYLSATKN